MQGAKPTCRARYGRVPGVTCGMVYPQALGSLTPAAGQPVSQVRGWSWPTERRKGSQMAESWYKGGAMRGRPGVASKAVKF